MRNPRGHTILVTVNNRILGADGRPSPEHGGQTTYEILTDPDRRAEHIRQLVEVSKLAHGLELNYERLPYEARDAFSAFVRDLRAALPAGKKLSIVLQPKFSNRSGSSGYAVDWAAVHPYADWVRIMAYYYSYSTSAPGPVVRYDQLARLADYALHDPDQGIPASKLAIILSLWGWDWPLDGGKGRLIQYDEAMALARDHGVVPARDPNEDSLHFRYRAANGVDHEVWIDDVWATRGRIDLLEKHGVPSVDFWHLNTGDPRTWPYIAANTVRLGAVLGAPIDFDGDGRTDVAVYRPSQSEWLIDSTKEGGTDRRVVFGEPGDVPVPADYNNDGRTDLAVFRPSTGDWAIDVTRDGVAEYAFVYGKDGDVPVPADYDGDGTADPAVFRPSTGGWWVDTSRNGGTNFSAALGRAGDVPVPADYDGDGVADFAVFRPSNGKWIVDLDRNGVRDLVVTYGQDGDVPLPGDYDGDGRADLAVFRPATSRWFVDLDRTGGSDLVVAYGDARDVPVPGDFDGDGRFDLAVFRPSWSGWYVDTDRNGGTDLEEAYGMAGDVPLRQNGWIVDAVLSRG
jgi:hypothetical protein